MNTGKFHQESNDSADKVVNEKKNVEPDCDKILNDWYCVFGAKRGPSDLSQMIFRNKFDRINFETFS